VPASNPRFNVGTVEQPALSTASERVFRSNLLAAQEWVELILRWRGVPPSAIQWDSIERGMVRLTIVGAAREFLLDARLVDGIAASDVMARDTAIARIETLLGPG
jgi:hypothetical protein